MSLPSLASLYVTLPQGELDALVSGLPHLTSLNGTQLDEATGDSAPPGPVVHPGERAVCRGRCSFVCGASQGAPRSCLVQEGSSLATLCVMQRRMKRRELPLHSLYCPSSFPLSSSLALSLAFSLSALSPYIAPLHAPTPCHSAPCHPVPADPVREVTGWRPCLTPMSGA